jgi:putative addiction module component (TIGR02574 family)
MKFERAREQRQADSTTSRYTPVMSSEALRLHQAAMQWSEAERIQLAVALTDNVDEGASDVEMATWTAEVRRRIAKGEGTAISKGTEVFRLYEAAMQLPDNDRAEFVVMLLEGLDERLTPEEIEASWIAEAKRRLEDIRAGRMATVPRAEAIRKARAALEQAKQARTR